MAYKDIRNSKTMKVIIVVVCVILALAMTIPSVAVLLGAGKQQSTSDQATSQAQQAESIIPGESTSLEDCNAYYEKLVNNVQAKVDADATNGNNFRMLGNNYMSWGSNLLTYHADSEEAKAQAATCWTKAAEAYKSALDISHSDPIALNYAQAIYMSGDLETARTELEALVEEAPNYANAWAFLSQVYNELGETDLGTQAYNKALELSGATASTAETTQTDTDADSSESQE